MVIAAPSQLTPSLQDAQRACEILVKYGAGLVLVFGSVARDTASENSDIDMVAVFDDLGDYTCRHNLRNRLINTIYTTTKLPVDVWVTDRAEWKHRTTKVTSSFEAAITNDAIVLHNQPATNSTIDWNKEIGMPKNNQVEALDRLNDTANALLKVLNGFYEGPLEGSDPNQEDTSRWARYERMANLCADSQLTIECAFKTVACLAGIKAERIHSIQKLADAIPETYSNVTSPATSEHNRIKPSGITLWHTAGAYSDVRPALTLKEIEDTATELAQMVCKTAAALVTHFTNTSEIEASKLLRIVNQVKTALMNNDIE